ncbi:MAG: hypothetical protein HUJ60_03970 [Bacilli bacterium]|nr:hypothetical protein [Bacilli bacterium]
MKAKSKVMLGLAAMLGVSAAVASYSTYAWFITTRIASVKIDSVGARSNDGSLYLTGLDDTCINLPQYKLDDAVAGEDDQGTELTFAYKTDGSDNIPLTDVSSDGKTFYKPIWNAKTHGNGHSNDTPTTEGAAVDNRLSASKILDVTSGDGDTSAKTGYTSGDEYLTDDDLGYFKQFKFQVNNTGTNPMNIYMSKVDDDTPMIKRATTSAATALEIGGFRLSVVVDDEVVFYYAPFHGDTMNYITSAGEGTKLYDVDERTKASIAATDVMYGAEGSGASGLEKKYTFAPIVDGGEGADILANHMIIENLKKDTPKTVTVNIWVEGESKYTDVNGMNGIVADFAFNLVALGYDGDASSSTSSSTEGA